MLKILIALLAVCCLLIPVSSAAEEVNIDEFQGLLFHGYDEDGLFVTVPADIGHGIGMVAGAIPAALTMGAFHIFYAPDYKTLEAGGVTMRCFTYPLGFLVGLPFKILKTVFWDAPAMLFVGTDETRLEPYVHSPAGAGTQAK